MVQIQGVYRLNDFAQLIGQKEQPRQPWRSPGAAIHISGILQAALATSSSFIT